MSQFPSLSRNAVNQLWGGPLLQSGLTKQWSMQNAPAGTGFSTGDTGDASMSRDLMVQSAYPQPDPLTSPFSEQPEVMRLESQDFEKIAMSYVTQLVMRGQDFPLTEIIETVLPLTRYYGAETGIEFQKTIFGTHYADVVPQLGIVRQMSQRYLKWLTRLGRFGVGVSFHHADLRTAKGRYNFMLKLQQVNICLRNTFTIEAWYKMMHTAVSNFTAHRLLGLSNHSEYTTEDVIEGEQRRWAYLLKHENAWAQLMAFATTTAAAQGCNINCLIMPQRLAAMYKWNHVQDEMAFLNVGPKGPAMARSIEDGPVQDQTRGRFKIIELPVMPGVDGEPAHDFTLSLRAIGEGFRFTLEDVMEFFPPSQHPPNMKIRVFNYKTDAPSIIHLVRMLECSGLFDVSDQKDSRIASIGVAFFNGCETFGDYLRQHEDALQYFMDVFNSKPAGYINGMIEGYLRIVPAHGPANFPINNLVKRKADDFKCDPALGLLLRIRYQGRDGFPGLAGMAPVFLERMCHIEGMVQENPAIVDRSETSNALIAIADQMQAALARASKQYVARSWDVNEIKACRGLFAASELKAQDAIEAHPFALPALQLLLTSYASVSNKKNQLAEHNGKGAFEIINEMANDSETGTEFARRLTAVLDADAKTNVADGKSLLASIMGMPVASFSLQFFKFLDQYGLPVCIDFLLARNNVHWTMHNILACDTNGLGRTYVMDPQVECANNGIQQFGQMSIHVNAGAVIEKSDNLVLLENVMPGKYMGHLGGGGVSLYCPMEDRTAYVEGRMIKGKTKDIFVLAKRPSEPTRLMYDLRGAWDDTGRAMQVNSGAIHYQMAGTYSEWWRWNQRPHSKNHTYEYNDASSDVHPFNTVIVQASQDYYDPQKGSFSNHVIGKGWFTDCPPVPGLRKKMEGEVGSVLPTALSQNVQTLVH